MGVKPKKSLGQNWLIQPRIAEEIVATGKVSKKDTVLEIGPGRGALTEKLLAAGAKVVAVEKDESLIPTLQEKFAKQIKSGKLRIISGDILELTPRKLDLKNYKLIANIPYYITGEIIRKFLTADPPAGGQPELMVLLVQKEVAERIIASDPRHSGANKKESILSLSVKLFGEPRMIKKVSRGSFFPVPKVDSAILLIENISYNKIKGFTQEKFFDLVKKGFSQKRKMLKSNLKLSAEKLAACGIAEKARAEDLTLENWLCLTKKSSA